MRVWGCDGDGNAGVGSGGGVVVVSACMSGTRGSGVMSNTGDVLEMSVVRGVGGVCDMCMCFARGGVGGEGGEWMRELGLGFTNPVGTGGVLDIYGISSPLSLNLNNPFISLIINNWCLLSKYRRCSVTNSYPPFWKSVFSLAPTLGGGMVLLSL